MTYMLAFVGFTSGDSVLPRFKIHMYLDRFSPELLILD